MAAVLIALALCGSLIALASPGAAGGGAGASKRVETPPPAVTLARAQSSASGSSAEFDPRSQRLEGTHYVSDLGDGRRAELTLDAGLQTRIQTMLRNYAVPYGAVVALEPASGRVLAYVSHSSANPNAGDLARDASAPSASVFKLVTAAALLDHGTVPDTRVCYSGGLRRLTSADIEDNPRRDRACATLEEAISGSINAVLAKLADRTLDRATLEHYAGAFGFGQPLVFDAPPQQSTVDVPEERIERARMAAGFWHTRMSPLHGALIAATIANGGAMPRASMIARVLDAEGRELKPPAAVMPPRVVISAATAQKLGQMMLGTVTRGTSRQAFHDTHGRAYLPGIAIAGKTGSLNSDDPFRAYSWWVGFAPQPEPEIALAVLIVNTPEWRIKASQVARDALRYYLVDRKTAQAKAERARKQQAEHDAKASASASARTMQAPAAAATLAPVAARPDAAAVAGSPAANPAPAKLSPVPAAQPRP